MRRIASSSHCSLPSQGITVSMLMEQWAGLGGTSSSKQPKLLCVPSAPQGGPGSSSLLLPHSPVQEWESDPFTLKSGSWGALEQHLLGFLSENAMFLEREPWCIEERLLGCSSASLFSKPAYCWLGMTNNYSSSFHQFLCFFSNPLFPPSFSYWRIALPPKLFSLVFSVAAINFTIQPYLLIT